MNQSANRTFSLVVVTLAVLVLVAVVALNRPTAAISSVRHIQSTQDLVNIKNF